MGKSSRWCVRYDVHNHKAQGLPRAHTRKTRKKHMRSGTPSRFMVDRSINDRLLEISRI